MANPISFVYSIQLLLLITSCLSTLCSETVDDRPMKRQSTSFEVYVDKHYSYFLHRHILKTLALPEFNAEADPQELDDMLQTDGSGYSQFNEVCTALAKELSAASKDPDFIDRDAMDKFRFCEFCEDCRTRWMTECSYLCCTLGLKSTYSAGCPGNELNAPPKGCCADCPWY